jgi:hypothetical protein
VYFGKHVISPISHVALCKRMQGMLRI